MINERVAALLIEQIGHEFSAHQAFFGTSLYFERQGLTTWARLFHGQSVEEAQHATRIISFLVENEVAFALPALGPGTADHASAAAAVRTALETEIDITGQFAVLATAATDSDDQRSREFLQWFIDEQAEGERMMRKLLDLVEAGIDLVETDALPDGAG
jgi:Ferritin-like protein